MSDRDEWIDPCLCDGDGINAACSLHGGEPPTTAPTPWVFDRKRQTIKDANGRDLVIGNVVGIDDEMTLMAAARDLRDALRDAGKFARHDDHCQRRLMVGGWQPDDPEPQCVCGFADVAERINDLLAALPVLPHTEEQ